MRAIKRRIPRIGMGGRGLFLVLLTFSGLAGVAADTEFQFTIAPPPVGYPLFDQGKTTHSLRGTYINISTDEDWSFDGLLASYAKQESPSQDLSFQQTFTGGVLWGDLPGADLTGLPLLYDFTPILRPYRQDNLDLLVFGILGGHATFFFLDLDDSDVSMQMLNYLLVPGAGVQANIVLSDFILSPFGVYRYSFGGYVTEYSGEDSPDGDSGSIDGYGSVIFGFDLLYRPLNLSLSSILQHEKDVTVFTISLGYSFSRSR